MTPRTLFLREHQTTCLPARELSDEHAELLWRRHKTEIAIEPPSFQNDRQWRLTPGGYVGQLVVGGDLRVYIEPKTPIASLFQMLCYAYRINFVAEGELAIVDSLAEFCSRLAEVLAKRVLDRSRRGFHRDYEGRRSRLPYLRGAPVIERRWSGSLDALLDCRYQEHTADILDNQILAWTLQGILRCGLGDDRTRQLVRRAYLATRSAAAPLPVCGEDCLGRVYTRLNSDYRPLHAICRFFLDGIGPSHQLYDRSAPPFLVDMPKLFEQFVAEWLRLHLPPEYDLHEQRGIRLGRSDEVSFSVDLVLLERATQRPIAVLDTKYKTSSSPIAGDVQQVIAYAKTLGCHEAILIYPAALGDPFEHTVGGDLHVSALGFDLSGNVDEGGREFLNAMRQRVALVADSSR